MKIYTKVVDKTISFKMVVDKLAIPVRNLCTLLLECDLYHHLFPFTKKSKRLWMFKHSS